MQLSKPPATGPMNKPQWKYGFLSILLLLLGFQIWWVAGLPADYAGSRFIGLVVGTGLLLNHLSFWFWFGPRIAVVSRVFSLLFTFGGLGFVLYSI